MKTPWKEIAMKMLSLFEMQSVPLLFNEKPSFSELVARVREELHLPWS